MDKTQLDGILEKHIKWVYGNDGGERANLSVADLSRAYLSRADLSGANLSVADLSRADLSVANLSGAYLSVADLSRADLSGANLSGAYLSRADLSGANLSGANLSGANLSGANLSGADLSGAYLSRADLSVANLSRADLSGAIGMIKLMGVCLGNRYYKAIDCDFANNDYTFAVGLNVLRDKETFAADDRVLCSSPGFHFASESWCKLNYGDRPYMCVIRIPTKEEYESIEINEPWATDGKASASAIIIEKVFQNGEDVTERLVGWADGKGQKL